MGKTAVANEGPFFKISKAYFWVFGHLFSKKICKYLINNKIRKKQKIFGALKIFKNIWQG
ncbi:MAG: hypothetical protein KA165_12655 [Saprospiraceae bacterium]|nr:hypothetical protein [Saprospiraceae bacterium]